MIRISVIIPTRNRPVQLAACLRALAVDFPQDAETIVVSDGSLENLEPVVAAFVDALRLRLLQMDHGGPSAARNRGLAAARGEIVAFTDDDCRPAPGWVSSIVSGVHPSPPRAVGGSTWCAAGANVYADAAHLLLFLLARYDQARSQQERFLPSNNFAFPTAALIAIGGFDESFRTAEDRELCRRWSDAGFELGRVADAVVEHDERLNLKTFIAKFRAYGRGAAQFHGSGGKASLRSSVGFHFRLPALIMPHLRERGWRRGSSVAALVLLWEAANLAGYLGQRFGAAAKAPAVAGNTERARIG